MFQIVLNSECCEGKNRKIITIFHGYPSKWNNYRNFSRLSLNDAKFFFRDSFLSTIGFGDIYPTNGFERIYTAFIFFLLGCSLVSWSVGNLMDVLRTLSVFDQEEDHSD